MGFGVITNIKIPAHPLYITRVFQQKTISGQISKQFSFLLFSLSDANNVSLFVFRYPFLFLEFVVLLFSLFAVVLFFHQSTFCQFQRALRFLPTAKAETFWGFYSGVSPRSPLFLVSFRGEHVLSDFSTFSVISLYCDPSTPSAITMSLLLSLDIHYSHLLVCCIFHQRTFYYS